jgi:hypothetical protein
MRGRAFPSGVPARACSCLLVPARACSCLLVPARACSCVRACVHEEACACVGGRGSDAVGVVSLCSAGAGSVPSTSPSPAPADAPLSSAAAGDGGLGGLSTAGRSRFRFNAGCNPRVAVSEGGKVCVCVCVCVCVWLLRSTAPLRTVLPPHLPACGILVGVDRSRRVALAGAHVFWKALRSRPVWCWCRTVCSVAAALQASPSDSCLRSLVRS